MMEIPAIVEYCGDTYTLRCRHPVPLTATGFTKVEARDKLEAELRDTLGVEVRVLVLGPDYSKPWLLMLGALPDDEATEDWVATMTELRRQAEQAAATPSSLSISSHAGPASVTGVRP
ncbi:MAG: hypothetical protein ACRC7O_02130 [Fimbriiglobus sp.]